MKIILGYSDTRTNNEDFVLTPYLFLVKPKNTKVIKIIGLGICWGFWSFFIATGKGIPKNYPIFINMNKNHTNEKS